MNDEIPMMTWMWQKIPVHFTGWLTERSAEWHAPHSKDVFMQKNRAVPCIRILVEICDCFSRLHCRTKNLREEAD